MKLYKVTKEKPQYEETYQVYIIAIDKRHAERTARTIYWYGQKCAVIVEDVEMTEECIIGTVKWYG